jgi:bisphosphoglycerate-dependent phosphoglycerate mutase
MPVELIHETHSWSMDNEAGLATGWLNGTLSERGRRPAAERGERSPADRLTAVFVSDLHRAVQTAQIAFADNTVPVFQDARLREVNYGQLNGVVSTTCSGGLCVHRMWARSRSTSECYSHAHERRLTTTRSCMTTHE